MARYPKATGGDEGQGTDQLLARFGVGEKTFYAEAEKRKTIDFIVLLANDDKTSVGITFENIGEERAGSGLGGVRVDDIDLSARRLEGAKIGSERGFELLDDNFELSFF